MLSPWPAHPFEFSEQGIQARFCDTRLAVQPKLAGIKHLNRLEQVLARNEWGEDDIQEGIMRDSRDNLIEGTMSNLFILNGDTLHTPDLSECGVQGIMRKQVMDLAAELGFSVNCTDYRRDVLEQADGLFFTNSIIGIWPVRQLGDLEFDSNRQIKRIQKHLDALRWQHAQSDF